jgi:hypothetical protein
MKLATKNLNRISKLRPPMVGGSKHKGGMPMESSGASPLRKAALTNMVMAETGSIASFYEDDFDTYADEMEEDDEDSRELELYKIYLSEDAELVKGIISAASGEVSPPHSPLHSPLSPLHSPLSPLSQLPSSLTFTYHI